MRILYAEPSSLTFFKLRGRWPPTVDGKVFLVVTSPRQAQLSQVWPSRLFRRLCCVGVEPCFGSNFRVAVSALVDFTPLQPIRYREL